MRKRMPRNGGTTLRMRRYNPLNTAPVPLGNSGVTPPAQILTSLDIDAQISFYGTYIIINEQVTLQNQDPVLTEAAARLGVSLRQTEDQLTRDVLVSTASFMNATGGFNGDNPTNISLSDVQMIVKTLQYNNARYISDYIQGSNEFATSPIRDSYYALCNSQLIGNLDGVNGFVAKAQYPRPSFMDDEYGSIMNLRFFTSSIGAQLPFASNLGNTVYPIICVGQEAYANIEQDGYSASFVYSPPSIAGGPLFLNSTAGWKMALVPRLLNDQWALSLRVTVA